MFVTPYLQSYQGRGHQRALQRHIARHSADDSLFKSSRLPMFVRALHAMYHSQIQSYVSWILLQAAKDPRFRLPYAYKYYSTGFFLLFFCTESIYPFAGTLNTRTQSTNYQQSKMSRQGKNSMSAGDATLHTKTAFEHQLDELERLPYKPNDPDLQNLRYNLLSNLQQQHQSPSDLADLPRSRPRHRSPNNASSPKTRRQHRAISRRPHQIPQRPHTVH